MSRPDCVVETEEWKLGCFFDWRAKPVRAKCEDCHGKGTVGGGFKDLDGPRPCTSCAGTGTVWAGPKTRPPAIPEALREHMRRAWWEFMNAQPQGGRNE